MLYNQTKFEKYYKSTLDRLTNIDMKTLKDLLTAKEDFEEIIIKLSNGKTMYVDFYNQTISRFSEQKGCEYSRQFYADRPKMVHLGKRYLKQQ